MNELKRKTKNDFLNPVEATACTDNLTSVDALYILHELHYPDTRKDVCLIKKTFVNMDGSFDVLYLVWKQGANINIEKIWSTSIYDPPEEQHLAVGYFLEEKENILVKIYFAGDLNKGANRKAEAIYSMKKEKLGLK